MNVQQAKTHLSRLLARVERGETIELARNGRAIARLEPVDDHGARPMGFVSVSVPDEFFAPLSDDELRDWER